MTQKFTLCPDLTVRELIIIFDKVIFGITIVCSIILLLITTFPFIIANLLCV